MSWSATLPVGLGTVGSFFYLKKVGSTDGGAGEDRETGGDVKREVGKTPMLVCAQCEHTIARADDAISVGGSHLHTFMNPAGFVFEVLCYRDAFGTLPVGKASGEWSWFPGYLWKIEVCGGCTAHVGWSFANEGDKFWGLVKGRIVEKNG